MSNAFHAKKQKILSQLDVPEIEYTDASPKGSVDEEIRELVNQINTTSGLVTTSSCSGRIAVFVDGLAKTDDATSNGQNIEPQQATTSRDAGNISSTSGSISIKTSGYWIFTSHKPLQSETYERPGSMFELIGFQRDAEPSFPLSSAHPRYIHFKFEPMVCQGLRTTH